jgi:hypothetical protein
VYSHRNKCNEYKNYFLTGAFLATDFVDEETSETTLPFSTFTSH